MMTQAFKYVHYVLFQFCGLKGLSPPHVSVLVKLTTRNLTGSEKVSFFHCESASFSSPFVPSREKPRSTLFEKAHSTLRFLMRKINCENLKVTNNVWSLDYLI